MEFSSKSLEETKKIATDFTASLKNFYQKDKAVVVGLYGELGSGKTTFMKYLAQALGVKEEIKSPTFVIMKKISLKGASEKAQTLVHIDAYRIDDSKEMEILNWREIINDSKNLVCVEWPEKIAPIMPSHIVIKFKHSKNENERKINIA